MRPLAVLCIAFLFYGAGSQDKKIQSAVKQLEELKTRNVFDRGPAEGTLISIGEPAVPAVLQLLKSENELTRHAAAEILTNLAVSRKKPVHLGFSETVLRNDVLPALTAALKDPSEWARAPVIGALFNIAQLDEESGKTIIPLLTGALSDPAAEIRSNAANCLGEIGPRAKEALPALVEALQRPDSREYDRVVFAVRNIGPGPEAVPGLITALTAKDRMTRQMAAEALGKIGPPAQAAVPALREAVANKSIGKAGTEALQKIEAK